MMTLTRVTLLIAAFAFATYAGVYSQATQRAKETFNRVEAANWLNSKMEDASGFTTNDAGYFPGYECSVNIASWTCEVIATHNRISYPEPITLSRTVYTATLSQFNPSSVVVIKREGKIYLEVSTTGYKNSVLVMTRGTSGSYGPLPKENSFLFGPFRTGENLEVRAKKVLEQLIITSGGKSSVAF